MPSSLSSTMYSLHDPAFFSFHDPTFFSFVDDVTKEMLGIADKLKPPCHNFAQLHYALESLKTDVNVVRDRDVVLSTPRTDLPSPGPAVILATGAPSPVPALGPAVILAIGAPSPAPATGPAVEPLAVDEEVAASEKTLALEEKASASEKQKAPALEEKAAASENNMTT